MVKTSHGRVAGLVSQRDGAAKWDDQVKIDIGLSGDLEWCFFQFECRGDCALASSQRHEVASAHDRGDSSDVEHHAQFKLEVWTLASSTTKSTEGWWVETMRWVARATTSSLPGLARVR